MPISKLHIQAIMGLFRLAIDPEHNKEWIAPEDFIISTRRTLKAALYAQPGENNDNEYAMQIISYNYFISCYHILKPCLNISPEDEQKEEKEKSFRTILAKTLSKKEPEAALKKELEENKSLFSNLNIELMQERLSYFNNTFDELKKVLDSIGSKTISEFAKEHQDFLQIAYNTDISRFYMIRQLREIITGKGEKSNVYRSLNAGSRLDESSPHELKTFITNMVEYVVGRLENESFKATCEAILNPKSNAEKAGIVAFLESEVLEDKESSYIEQNIIGIATAKIAYDIENNKNLQEALVKSSVEQEQTSPPQSQVTATSCCLPLGLFAMFSRKPSNQPDTQNPADRQRA